MAIDRKWPCDFYFGDRIAGKIKKMDYGLLKGNVKELQKVILYSNFYILIGAMKVAFKKQYKTFLLTGEPYCLSNWGVLIYAKLVGKKTYLWSHGWYGNESGAKKTIKKNFFRLATGILLYGEFAKKMMIENGIPAKKLSVIYNSLDYDSQLELRKGFRKTEVFSDYFCNKGNNILFIGRLTAIKQLDLLIESLRLTLENRRMIPFNLILVGDGPVRQKLEQLVIQYNLVDWVWFYGACYDEEKICELIYNADLCVSPGNVGLTAIHSLGYGTPVITHDNFSKQMPEFEAIQQGVTGDFFREGEVEDLTRKIQQWIKIHPDKTEQIIKNCLRVIDNKYNPLFQVRVLQEQLALS